MLRGFRLSCFEEYEALRFRAWRVSDFGSRLSDLVGFWVLGFRVLVFLFCRALRKAWRVSDFGCRLSDLVGCWVLGFRGFGFFILSCFEEYEAIRFRAWRVSDFGCRLSDLVGVWVLGFWVF